MIMNHKKLYRLYTEEKLGVRRRRGRKRARGSRTLMPVALRPGERPLSVIACNHLPGNGSLRDELLNEELFDSLDEARRKLALWRYDYNHVRPHSSFGNKTPVEARRALEQFEGIAHDALAQNEAKEYEIQTRKLSL